MKQFVVFCNFTAAGSAAPGLSISRYPPHFIPKNVKNLNFVEFYLSHVLTKFLIVGRALFCQELLQGYPQCRLLLALLPAGT